MCRVLSVQRGNKTFEYGGAHRKLPWCLAHVRVRLQTRTQSGIRLSQYLSDTYEMLLATRRYWQKKNSVFGDGNLKHPQASDSSFAKRG